jgi:hypothetical protein
VGTLASVGWAGSLSCAIGRGPRWVAVLCYAVAAWRCGRLARATGPAGSVSAVTDSAPGVVSTGGERICWRILSAVLLALGIYKLFDLQTPLGQWGRTVASEHDWYQTRRPVQLVLIGAVVATTAAVAALSVWLARRMPAATRAAIAGVVALIGFVAIRTISFHYLDELLDRSLGGLKLNWVIELGGISAILVSTQWRIAGRGVQDAEWAPNKKQ